MSPCFRSSNPNAHQKHALPNPTPCDIPAFVCLLTHQPRFGRNPVTIVIRNRSSPGVLHATPCNFHARLPHGRIVRLVWAHAAGLAHEQDAEGTARAAGHHIRACVLAAHTRSHRCWELQWIDCRLRHQHGSRRAPFPLRGSGAFQRKRPFTPFLSQQLDLFIPPCPSQEPFCIFTTTAH